MTLQNGLLTADAAYLWSDAGFYSWEEKRLLYFEDKIFGGFGLPWAIVHSGTDEVGREVEDAICEAQPMTLAALVPCIRSTLAKHLAHEWPGGQGVLIAAWDDRPRLLVMRTIELAGYPPLHPIAVRTLMISSNSDAIAREVAKGVTPDTMLRVIRQQHAESHLDGHWPMAGKVTRARVSAEGAEFTVVDELPDPMAVEASQ